VYPHSLHDVYEVRLKYKVNRNTELYNDIVLLVSWSPW